MAKIRRLCKRRRSCKIRRSRVARGTLLGPLLRCLGAPEGTTAQAAPDERASGGAWGVRTPDPAVPARRHPHAHDGDPEGACSVGSGGRPQAAPRTPREERLTFGHEPCRHATLSMLPRPPAVDLHRWREAAYESWPSTTRPATTAARSARVSRPGSPVRATSGRDAGRSRRRTAPWATPGAYWSRPWRTEVVGSSRGRPMVRAGQLCSVRLVRRGSGASGRARFRQQR
jgi:hypothetical protein